MQEVDNVCRCACGELDFELRLKTDEQVGLLTCAAGHHSLLLDSRDYWADVLQDGRPKVTRCPCGSRRFRVELRYDFRRNGDVRSVLVKALCATCGRRRTPIEVDIKYSPTNHLVELPLDPIAEPWQQPKRRQITALWKPSDAERFASFLAHSLHARVFAMETPYQFTEATLAKVEFYPELKHDLLFTNVDDPYPLQNREPEKTAPFLRVRGPFHMCYSGSSLEIQLLHYVEYSLEIVRQGRIEQQPKPFLEFARQACEWLNTNFVSFRGKMTADNPEEYIRFKKSRSS